MTEPKYVPIKERSLEAQLAYKDGYMAGVRFALRRVRWLEEELAKHESGVETILNAAIGKDK